MRAWEREWEWTCCLSHSIYCVKQFTALGPCDLALMTSRRPSQIKFMYKILSDSVYLSNISGKLYIHTYWLQFRGRGGGWVLTCVTYLVWLKSCRERGNSGWEQRNLFPSPVSSKYGIRRALCAYMLSRRACFPLHLLHPFLSVPDQLPPF